MTVELVNDRLRVVVAPERGAEVRFFGPPGGPNLLAYDEWTSPARAGRGLSYGTSFLDWVSEYRGGWQELFPNAGADCEVDGVPLPFHGEVSALPWDVVRSSPDEVIVRTPTRLPLVLERRMRLAADAPALHVEETATNESPVSVDFLWGHHPAFDAESGATIDLPGATVHVDTAEPTPLSDLQPGAEGRWPHVQGRDGEVDLSRIPAQPTERLCYLADLEAPWAALRRPSGLGVALAWDGETFPHAWFWQQIGGPGFPWYGRARIAAVEPSTAWPADGLAAAATRGQAHRLEGGGQRQTWLTMALFTASERPVAHVDRNGRVKEVENSGGE